MRRLIAIAALLVPSLAFAQKAGHVVADLAMCSGPHQQAHICQVHDNKRYGDSQGTIISPLTNPGAAPVSVSEINQAFTAKTDTVGGTLTNGTITGGTSTGMHVDNDLVGTTTLANALAGTSLLTLPNTSAGLAAGTFFNNGGVVATATADPTLNDITISGTGSVASRLGQVYDVMDAKYGAKGNGVTDDTAAFRAAIAAIESNPNGGVLYVPAARYIVSGTLTVALTGHQVFIMRGEGKNLSEIQFNVASGNTDGLDVSYGSGYSQNNSRGFAQTTLNNSVVVRGLDFINNSAANQLGTGNGISISASTPGNLGQALVRDVELQGAAPGLTGWGIGIGIYTVPGEVDDSFVYSHTSTDHWGTGYFCGAASSITQAQAQAFGYDAAGGCMFRNDTAAGPDLDTGFKIGNYVQGVNFTDDVVLGGYYGFSWITNGSPEGASLTMTDPYAYTMQYGADIQNIAAVAVKGGEFARMEAPGINYTGVDVNAGGATISNNDFIMQGVNDADANGIAVDATGQVGAYGRSVIANNSVNSTKGTGFKIENGNWQVADNSTSWTATPIVQPPACAAGNNCGYVTETGNSWNGQPDIAYAGNGWHQWIAGTGAANSASGPDATGTTTATESWELDTPSFAKAVLTMPNGSTQLGPLPSGQIAWGSINAPTGYGSNLMEVNLGSTLGPYVDDTAVLHAPAGFDLPYSSNAVTTGPAIAGTIPLIWDAHNHVICALEAGNTTYACASGGGGSTAAATSTTAGTVPNFGGASGAAALDSGSHLTPAEAPALTGDVTSAAGSTATTLAATGVAAGTCIKATVDAKGRATGCAALATTDLPTAAQTAITQAGAAATQTALSSETSRAEGAESTNANAAAAALQPAAIGSTVAPFSEVSRAEAAEGANASAASAAQTTANAAIPSSLKGTASGDIPVLGIGGVLPSSEVPSSGSAAITSSSTYNAAGASAISRTLAETRSDATYATDYGMACDGTVRTTNSSSNIYSDDDALDNAVAAALAHQTDTGRSSVGAQVILPAGSCMLTRAHDYSVTEPISVVGAGIGMTFIHTTSTGDGLVFSTTNNSNIMLGYFKLGRTAGSLPSGTLFAGCGVCALGNSGGVGNKDVITNVEVLGNQEGGTETDGWADCIKIQNGVNWTIYHDVTYEPAAPKTLFDWTATAAGSAVGSTSLTVSGSTNLTPYASAIVRDNTTGTTIGTVSGSPTATSLPLAAATTSVVNANDALEIYLPMPYTANNVLPAPISHDVADGIAIEGNGAFSIDGAVVDATTNGGIAGLDVTDFQGLYVTTSRFVYSDFGVRADVPTSQADELFLLSDVHSNSKYSDFYFYGTNPQLANLYMFDFSPSESTNGFCFVCINNAVGLSGVTGASMVGNNGQVGGAANALATAETGVSVVNNGSFEVSESGVTSQWMNGPTLSNDSDSINIIGSGNSIGNSSNATSGNWISDGTQNAGQPFGKNDYAGNVIDNTPDMFDDGQRDLATPHSFTVGTYGNIGTLTVQNGTTFAPLLTSDKSGNVIAGGQLTFGAGNTNHQTSMTPVFGTATSSTVFLTPLGAEPVALPAATASTGSTNNANNSTISFAALPANIVVGQRVYDSTTQANMPLSLQETITASSGTVGAAGTITVSPAITSAGVTSGDNVSFNYPAAWESSEGLAGNTDFGLLSASVYCRDSSHKWMATVSNDIANYLMQGDLTTNVTFSNLLTAAFTTTATTLSTAATSGSTSVTVTSATGIVPYKVTAGSPSPVFMVDVTTPGNVPANDPVLSVSGSTVNLGVPTGAIPTTDSIQFETTPAYAVGAGTSFAFVRGTVDGQILLQMVAGSTSPDCTGTMTVTGSY